MAKAKILIVEDELIVAEEIKHYLQNFGYEISEVVNSGEKAIEQTHELKPDLVLMDIMLQGALTGIQAAQQIRIQHNIPVIYLTAFAENETVELAKKTGPYGFLTKPIKYEELQRTIDMALYKHGMENKLRISEEQLRQSQKMQTIGTLAGGIAHDFNNILSPLFGYTEMLLQDVPQRGRLHDDLEQILKAAKRAKDLVSQILTFSRQDESKPKPLHIHFIVKEALKLLQASLPATIKIIKHVQSDCGVILADATQIHQVIMNLCTNASYAMRENGGTLEVKLDKIQLDARKAMKFEDLDNGTYVRLSVRDTGQGMDKKTIDRIFEPFFTTKPVGQGTGLGLSVTHGIVENHGGAIVVDSEPGKGSTFQVFLPTIQEKIKDATVNINDTPQGNNEHILLVDNEEGIVVMLKTMLERLGYAVTEKTASLQALEAFRNAPQDFDVAISDQTMPDMTGAQLSKQLISIRSDTPIILCTGFSETINRKKAEKMGIKGYITKPFSQKDIALKIRQVLDNNY